MSAPLRGESMPPGVFDRSTSTREGLTARLASTINRAFWQTHLKLKHSNLRDASSSDRQLCQPFQERKGRQPVVGDLCAVKFEGLQVREPDEVDQPIVRRLRVIEIQRHEPVSSWKLLESRAIYQSAVEAQFQQTVQLDEVRQSVVGNLQTGKLECFQI